MAETRDPTHGSFDGTTTGPPEHPPRPWLLDIDEVALMIASDATAGLSPDEAGRRLEEHGPNELTEKPPKPKWLLFGEQFANTMIVVLLVAVAITIAIGDVKDAVVIVAIVVANAVIGFVQEARAERAMSALKRMTAPTARVVRAGETITVPARQVVPGDLLVLDAGEIVPADARLADAPNLRVNESALTGESVPVDKRTDALRRGEGETVGDRTNMAFKGSAVVFGRGTAVVTATGMHTALGEIAGLLQAHRTPKTPLQRRIAVLGRRLAVAALAVTAIVFVSGIARGEDPTLMFLTAVSLAVAAIPEALPAVVTVALAFGAKRMADRRALVRKLPAVETLGSVTVICTDKTGTLTQGRMLVERIRLLDEELTVTGSGYEPAGDVFSGGSSADPSRARLRSLLRAAVLCNDATLVPPSAEGGDWDVSGDPTEGALLSMAAKGGVDAPPTRRELPRLAEEPFDAVRRRMTTTHEGPEGRRITASKGAVEAIMPTADRVVDDATVRPVTDGDRAHVEQWADDYAAQGYRVLAIAGDDGAGRDGRERSLVLYGLVAMADPLRDGVAQAVEECRTAGIEPVLITGDHPATARAIAARAGIADDGGIMTGAEMAALDDDSLRKVIDRIDVFARTEPEQKLRIVEAWKERGSIVAMTGDGVNDAPALRRADIGVAMGIAGTEVSKEAADMVLADDDFSTIVRAVREGRRIYDNIRRFVRYMLTANSGEIWVIFLAPFFGLPLPLLPVQILWINLVTDGLPAVALGFEPPEPGVMRRPPREPSESVLAGGLWQHVLFIGLLMGAVPLALGLWGEATGRPWQTMVFTSLALLQLGHALAVRSETETLRRRRVRTNVFLMTAVAGTAALQIGMLWIPVARRLLDIEPLEAGELAIVLASSTIVFLVVEAGKVIQRRRITR
jgi:Ca2+-transporting ATPase